MNYYLKKLVRSSVGCVDPITKNIVTHEIARKYYYPLSFLGILKETIKRLIGHKNALPPLYYNSDTEFCFFKRPSEEFIENLYGNSKNIEPLDSKVEFRNATSKTRNASAYLMLEWIKKAIVENKIKGIRNIKTGKACDFGAGSGWFSHVLDKSGLDTTATDFSQNVLEVIHMHSPNVRVVSNDNFWNLEDKYDLIVSFDVFEHLIDPLKLLRELASKLQVGGCIFISVPNFSSLFFSFSLIKHPYFSYPAHLNYFSLKSVERLFKEAGLTTVACESITLDWESEYIRRAYDKNIPLKAYRLFDLWSEQGNGERLLCLATKIKND